jgi:hypothetical protein
MKQNAIFILCICLILAGLCVQVHGADTGKYKDPISLDASPYSASDTPGARESPTMKPTPTGKEKTQDGDSVSETSVPKTTEKRRSEHTPAPVKEQGPRHLDLPKNWKDAPDKNAVHTFSYATARKNTDYTLTVPINTAVLKAAKTQGMTFSDMGDPQKTRDAVRIYLEDPAFAEFYPNLEYALLARTNTANDYVSGNDLVDYVIAYVNTMNNKDTKKSTESFTTKLKYPVEVVADEAGNSFEKSLLCAKILSDMGYDVAVIVFPDSKYAGLGLRAHCNIANPSIRLFTNEKGSYAFVDVAHPGFVSWVPDHIRDNEEYTVIPVGAGTKEYTNIDFNWKLGYDHNNLEKPVVAKSTRTTIDPNDKYRSAMVMKNTKHKKTGRGALYTSDM